MTITDDLVEFAEAEPPAEARAIMRLSALDWAACGIAGAREGSFEGFVAPYRAGGACALFGGGASGAAEAALVNGTLSHALDYDDTHFDHIGHPSVAILPAALAVGQLMNADLDSIIDSALVGAEASIAVGIWLGRAHYQIGYHQTATAGAFGATLACARLLGLNAAQRRTALGLASTMASGLKSQFGTMGKPLNAGFAARTGVEAALWASRGVTSSHDGLVGPLGFGATHHGADADVQLPVEAWRMERVSYKFHACCHGLHAALEALSSFKGQTPKLIEVFTHPRWLTVCNISDPKTGLEAKFSYRLTAAMALMDRSTGDIDTYQDELVSDPELCKLRDLVTVYADEGLTEMQARVLVDGVEAFHDLDAPIPLDTRRAKIIQKARSIADDAADGLTAALETNDLHGFVELMS